MKLIRKNFPHPVLSPYSDDIDNSHFGCGLSVEHDQHTYFFKYEITLSNSTLLSLIENEKAAFFVHIECGRTFYRKAHRIKKENFKGGRACGTISIPWSSLVGSVEVNIFACAVSPIQEYSPEGMHTDYQQRKFALDNGDFAAVWKTSVFDLYPAYDPIRKPDSIICFQLDRERETGEINVIFDADKLTACLPADLYQKYEALRSDKGKEEIVMAMLAIPVLMEGLWYLKEEKEHASENRRYKWFRSLEKKLRDMKNKNADIEEDSVLSLAQKIFENPYQRAGDAFEQIDISQQGETDL
ncbi:MAG TPA: hypothetical protein PK525_12710 [Anaerohalosphaeraceae bacterium]|nr:hypothetical protein [Anaerohalosphaeraceae bacterium]HRT24721.1 hypothetical protein [Anaerohalosphaeraceae bacterium]